MDLELLTIIGTISGLLIIGGASADYQSGGSGLFGALLVSAIVIPVAISILWMEHHLTKLKLARNNEIRDEIHDDIEIHNE